MGVGLELFNKRGELIYGKQDRVELLLERFHIILLWKWCNEC